MFSIIDRFESWGEKCPDKIFADDGDRCITYAEAIALSKRIGGILAAEDGFVCIRANKNLDSLLLLIGSIYAGRPYVFFNPTAPDERMIDMINITGATTIYLENNDDIIGLKKDLKLISISSLIDDAKLLKLSERMVTEKSMGDTLLYGMFTSGTTGRPKLVVVSHKGVIDFIEDFIEATDITHDAIIANQAPFDFDVSVKDIFSTIFCGGTLMIIKKEMLTHADELWSYLSEKRVNTLIWAVTALCMMSGAADFGKQGLNTIQKVMFSGEVMPMPFYRKWKAAFPEAKFFNLYGPTESVCNCTYYETQRGDEELDKLPIGIPFKKRKIFLIDDNGRIVTERFATGEICVGGRTLAVGYMNDMDETEKRFVRIVVDGEEEQVYKTGDIGYYGEKGILYYSGRNDFQIKRMGHRIELEEIDSKIVDLDNVDYVCSLYDESTQKLCTFIAGSAKKNDIRIILRNKLPRYMLPNRIISIDRMPMNKNGKIDRSKLKEDYASYFK